MLHHTGKITIHPFIVHIEVFILICDVYAFGTSYVLMYSGKRETSFFHRVLRTLGIIFHNMLPLPTRCLCPTYWSRVTGLILSGRGGSILFTTLLSVIAISDKTASKAA